MKDRVLWYTKSFEELTIYELYDILRLRSEVFVVEQDCVYQDVDGKDKKAQHVFGVLNGKVVAYARIFNRGEYFEDASIGRVVVLKEERANKYGHILIEKCIESVAEIFNTSVIKISAQTHLKKFYEAHGFKGIGEEYLEDNIPHIAMIKK